MPTTEVSETDTSKIIGIDSNANANEVLKTGEVKKGPPDWLAKAVTTVMALAAFADLMDKIIRFVVEVGEKLLKLL